MTNKVDEGERGLQKKKKKEKRESHKPVEEDRGMKEAFVLLQRGILGLWKRAMRKSEASTQNLKG